MAHGWRTGVEVKGKLANGVGSQYSHTPSERGVSSITTADAHTSSASSRLNWLPRRFKWTRPFRRKTKCGFCACAIRFRTCSTTGPQPLPKPVLHTARSSVSSFNFQYPVSSLRPSSSCLRHLPRVPVRSVLQSCLAIRCSRRQFPTPDVTNPVSLPSLYCLLDIFLVIDPSSFLTRSSQLIFSVLLKLHVLSFQVFLIYCPKCPIPYPIQSLTISNPLPYTIPYPIQSLTLYNPLSYPIPYPIHNNFKYFLLSHRAVSMYKDDLHHGDVCVRVLIEMCWGFIKKCFKLACLLGCRCGVCDA